jgi:hypothetical protein
MCRGAEVQRYRGTEVQWCSGAVVDFVAVDAQEVEEAEQRRQRLHRDGKVRSADVHM